MAIKFQKIEVFDAYAEKLGKGPVKVATVTIDQRGGKLEVHDARFKARLEDLFLEPQVLGRGGIWDGLAADGFHEAKPWSAEALEHATKYGLPAHNLRAEVVKR